MTGRPLLCRVGFHAWARADPERGPAQGPVQQVCRACGRQREVVAYRNGWGDASGV